jgi:hypothetical protein
VRIGRRAVSGEPPASSHPEELTVEYEAKRKKKGKRRPYYRDALVSVLAFLSALLFVCGCATSYAYQQGAADAGELVGERTKAYALQKQDPQASMDAERLLSLCEQRDKLTLEAFETAWTPVREKYLLFVEQDPRLTQADRALRRTTVDKVDGLIAKERARARSTLPFTQRP